MAQTSCKSLLPRTLSDVPHAVTSLTLMTMNQRMTTMSNQSEAMMQDQIEGAISENEQLRRDLEIALDMLAQWCVAVDENGTGWDDWDEHYKDAMYRPGPLREQLDAAIAHARNERQ
jgi:hypothetical protein